jgi:hypothetical protein
MAGYIHAEMHIYIDIDADTDIDIPLLYFAKASLRIIVISDYCSNIELFTRYVYYALLKPPCRQKTG